MGRRAETEKGWRVEWGGGPRLRRDGGLSGEEGRD